MDQSLKQKIVARLGSIEDPELHVDIVSLGLIYEIALSEAHCRIIMSLTYPGCPLGPYFEQKIATVLSSLPGIGQPEVQIVFQPPWKPGMMDPRLRHAYQRG